MRPVLFEIGGLTVYSFGLMAALALIVPGIFIVRPLIRRRGVPGDFAFELIIAAGVGGFVGARVYYVLENWSRVSDDVAGALFGGIGFTWYGGLIGGFLGVVGWTLVRRVPLGVIANATAPATALGYAIGRLGCQLAGDGDYGRPSDLPWAMGYPNGTVPTPPGVEVHPTPVYEILAMIPIIWVLWWLATRFERSGWWTFGWFLVLSGVERFLVEFVRRNPDWLAGLTQPQWVSIASVTIGVVLIAVYRGRPAELGPATAETRAARRRAQRA
jgi:phosphatidylglycerol:prolipoprotein diacylglycerol transferase